MSNEYQNKWALVTGSSRGVGQLVALELAEMGCKVIVHGRTAESTTNTIEKFAAIGQQVPAVYGELSTIEGMQQVIEQVKAITPDISILYNNAAIIGEWTEITEVPHDAWIELLMVNLIAVTQLCNAFVPTMKEAGYGRIVNVTSGIKDTPHLEPYSVSKAAIDRYTHDLAVSLADTNVMAFTMDPGWLKTDMGGQDAHHEPTTVIPGAITPILVTDKTDNGRRFAAQDFKHLTRK